MMRIKLLHAATRRGQIHDGRCFRADHDNRRRNKERLSILQTEGRGFEPRRRHDPPEGRAWVFRALIRIP
jgi:hypothetical protein